MLIKISGLVLQTIRHNDSTDIVTLYTRERGRMSLLVRGGSSRTARQRRARLAPLALVDTEVNFRETRDLQFAGEIATPYPWRNIYFDPMKGAMTIFMGEFLNRLLRVSDPDPNMWRFLLHAIHSLDILDQGIANYHLTFLIRMLPLVGIEPDLTDYRPDSYFDMQSGVFTVVPPLHRNVVLPAESAAIPELMRMDFHNLHHFRMNVGQRRMLLNRLIHYYSLHLPVGEDLKSLDVLRELFS